MLDNSYEGMERKKILHLVTQLSSGGPQESVIKTVRYHDRTSFEVHMAANPAGSGWREAAGQIVDAFHPQENLVSRTPHPFRDARALAQLHRLMRRERFDLVHTHGAKAGFLGRVASVGAGVPRLVHTVHGHPFHSLLSFWKRHLYVNLERAVRSAADVVITLSEADRREGVENGTLLPERTRVIHTQAGEVQSAASGGNGQEHFLREELEIPERAGVILTAGRLEHQRAPLMLLEGLRLLLENHPDTVLLVAGEGSMEEDLLSFSQEIGVASNVRLLRRPRDRAELFRVSDVFAGAAVREELSTALVEAMLAGLPVVSTATESVRELVIHQKTGLLFPPGNVARMRGHLDHLLRHAEERRRFGENARDYARAHLNDAEGRVRRIEKVYKDLLDPETEEEQKVLQ